MASLAATTTTLHAPLLIVGSTLQEARKWKANGKNSDRASRAHKTEGFERRVAQKVKKEENEAKTQALKGRHKSRYT